MLAFAGLFGEQSGPSGRACTGPRSRRASTMRPSWSRRRGATVDRNGVQLAIGRRATPGVRDPSTSPTRRPPRSPPRKYSVSCPATRKLYRPLADQSRGFVYVARKADAKHARRARAEGDPGPRLDSEERRVYPQGPVGAHVLGDGGGQGPVRARAGAERDAGWRARTEPSKNDNKTKKEAGGRANRLQSLRTEPLPVHVIQ